MAKAKCWKSVLEGYGKAVKAGNQNRRGCIPVGMTRQGKPIGATKPILPMNRLDVGKRIGATVVRFRLPK